MGGLWREVHYTVTQLMHSECGRICGGGGGPLARGGPYKRGTTVLFSFYYYYFLNYLYRVLYTGNNCAANDNFPHTMYETDNKGILLEWTTSLDTSSRTLFVREGGRMSVHVKSNFELRNNVRLLLNVELRNYVISRQIVI